VSNSLPKPLPSETGLRVHVRTVPETDFVSAVRLSELLAWETDPVALLGFDPARAVAALHLIAADRYGRILGAYTSSGLAGVLLLGGMVVSEWSAGRYLAVTSLIVDRPFRGRGIGTALYSAARDVARSLGAVGLELHVREDNLRAQKLYAELGLVTQPYRLMREQF
jgi:ribosomal protein S18 acetylase RimI-like enzyme